MFIFKPQLKISGFDALAAFAPSHQKATTKVFADRVSVMVSTVKSTYRWEIPKFSDRRLTTGNIEATFEISGLTESAMAYANTQIEKVAPGPQSFVTQLATQFEVEGADVPPNMGVVVEDTLAPTLAPTKAPSTSTDDEGNNKNPLIFSATAAVVFLIASACGYRNYGWTGHQSGSGFINLTPATLEVFASLDRL
jgi:hypothetical protein